MKVLQQDLAFAIRILLKKPAFALISIFTLALGIGANTTIFSLIDGVLLRPLPYTEPERIFSLWTSYPASHGQPDIFSPPNYLDLAARTRTLEAVGAYDILPYTLTGGGQAESVSGVRLTASMRQVLGLSPQLGRWFTPEEDDGAQTVVLLSDGLWRSRFGADRQILGRGLLINGRSYQVVGVMPQGAGFPSLATDLYVPMSFLPNDLASRGNVEYNVAARVRRGIALATAEAELHTIAASLARAYPDIDQGIQMGAVSMRETLTGSVRGVLVVLWAAVAFMLAVACANVASLLLAHATARRREFAMRRSLGATNGRLIRQLLTESVLLACAGGGLGLAFALYAIPLVAAHLPAGFPRLYAVRADASVLLFSAGVSLLTGILFGLAPAFGSKGDLSAAIRQSDGRGGQSVAHRRWGRGLIAGEIAVVVLLLIGAGLVLRSLVRLSSVYPGFRAPGLVAWQLILPPVRYANATAQRTFFHNVAEQVSSLPGVASAAFVDPLPFGPVDITIDGGFRIDGRPDPAPGQFPQALLTRITPGYFSTMGITLRGRELTERDGESAPPVAIISETLARRNFAGQNPIGQRIILGRRQPLDLEIVAVAGDVKHNNLRSDVRPELYIPLARFTPGIAGLVVRAKGDAAALLPAVQSRVRNIDSNMAFNLAAPVETFLYSSLAPARIAAVLLAAFALTTLLLGLAGIYGVLSYAIGQRTREIGIRLALGAAPAGVLRMVLGETLALSAAGVALGVAAAFLLTRYLDTLLFGVRALDPATYIAAAVAAPLAALLAAYTPARQAMRVDPARSLRAD